MNRSRVRATVSGVFVVTFAVAALGARGKQAAPPRPGVDWPGFRGIQARGFADGKPTAAVWDVPAGRNVRWKVKVPGLSHSSPVIWGDRVCVTTAVSGKDDPLRVGLYGDIASVDDSTPHQWRVLCYDKASGRLLWDRTATQGVPKVKRHTKATQANATPAVDTSQPSPRSRPYPRVKELARSGCGSGPGGPQPTNRQVVEPWA